MSLKDTLPPDIRKRFKRFDELTRDEQLKITEFYQKLVKREIAPYSKYIEESSKRAHRLINMYIARLKKRGLAKSAQDGSEDILRAVIVLTHASLEDFLRTLAETFLPLANEEALSRIPLAGLSGRVEKFSLGKLIQHKGKSVDYVIKESVRQHLDRSTYNNVQDIVDILSSLGFDSSEHDANFSKIELMMKRRHQIVHRGDMIKANGSKGLRPAPVGLGDVLQWVQAAYAFMFSLFPRIANKQIELQLEEKVRNAKGVI
jgi:RiboL-PSP-HEPN